MKDDKTCRLPDRTAIATHMKAIVTLNVVTDADLANGSRGEVIDVREPNHIPSATVELEYPPAMVCRQDYFTIHKSIYRRILDK
jgi:hypothetical protein